MLYVRALVPSLGLAIVIVAGLSFGEAKSLDLRTEMTGAEFTRCGLSKLTTDEIRALEEWLGRHADAGTAPRSLSSPRASEGDPRVAFNVSTHKIHCPTCRHALACTKNCIEMRFSEARERGGVPCGTCGGFCRLN